MGEDDEAPTTEVLFFSLTEMVDTPPTAVPPRATSHGTNGRGRSQTIVRNQDFRQLLIGMGFPKHRAYVMGGKRERGGGEGGGKREREGGGGGGGGEEREREGGGGGGGKERGCLHVK